MPQKTNQTESTSTDIKDAIGSYYLFWIGLLILGLSVAALFINTEWVFKSYMEAVLTHGSNDSDAARFLYEVELKLLEFALWLKKLPVAIKITGVVVGGLISLVHKPND